MLSQLSLATVAFLAASSAFAKCDNLFEGALRTGKVLVGNEVIDECKTVPNQRREQDAAVAYVQTRSGGLFRIFDIATKNNPYLACSVTTNVKEFKLSNHEEDASLVYFVRGAGDINEPVSNPAVLFRMTPGRDPIGKQCPSTKPKTNPDGSVDQVIFQIGYHIRAKSSSDYMFEVVQNKGSNAMVVGQHTHNIIAVWDKTGSFYNAPTVEDYYAQGLKAVDFRVNKTTFMKSGAPGSNILVFVQLNNGKVIHVTDNGSKRFQKTVEMRGPDLDAHVANVTNQQSR
ncbi:MAG: hypothetical protein K2X47_13735 [Bdellovibrionales bacterium]|nr:hypothetical protein [Bdellovibrionales bacterium]